MKTHVKSKESIAYLILAHKAPTQLMKLVKSLFSKDDYFIIHLDLRCDICEFQKPLRDYSNVIFINQRYEANWGSYGLIEATLTGFRFIMGIHSVKRVVLLSGQDYPIKNLIQIKSYLTRNPSCIFMECFQIPADKWYCGGTKRFPCYDEIKEMMDLYGGSQWMSFPVSILTVIFDFLKLNPLYISYFKLVHIPDECFFQTLLMNCGLDEVTKEIVGTNLHLEIWEINQSHPNILTKKDLPAIIRSDMLFARKFELEASSQLLNFIDEEILSKDSIHENN